MVQKHKLEGFVLRYAPTSVQRRSAEVGVILREPGAGAAGFAEVRFTNQWRQVLCVDPDADIELLEALEREIRQMLRDPQERELFVKRLGESFSGCIQADPVAVFATSSPAEELEKLAAMYLALPTAGRGRPSASGRAYVRKRMASEFERAGILELLMKDIPMAQYTGEGDPLRIDFAYRVKDTFKMFHAVSLKASVDQAIVLGLKYPKIEEGIRKMQGLESRLTAVLEDGVDRTRADVGYALATMEQNRVQVAYLAEMPQAAENARRELGQTSG